MTTQPDMPTLFGRVTTVFKEHADLRPIIARLRTYATDAALGRQPGVDLQTVLDEFFDQLLTHFAAEENEGYFGTLIADCPDLSAHVERLMAEHEDMVDVIERLRVLAENPNGARNLGLGLLTLLAQFEGHEHEENMLMRTFLAMAPVAERPAATRAK